MDEFDMSNYLTQFKVVFGRRVKEVRDETDPLKRHAKNVWLIENMSRIYKKEISIDNLTEDEIKYINLADEYIVEKGDWLRRADEEHELRKKISLKQVEFDSDGKILSNDKIKNSESMVTDHEKKDEKNEQSSGEFFYWSFLLVIGYFTVKFIEQWYSLGFKNIDRGLVVVPIIWGVFGALASVANEDFLKKIGLGFIPKAVKFSFFGAIFLFVVSILSQCSGFSGGSGLPDNIRM